MISNDLSIYTDYAAEWWDQKSPRFRSLQRITPFRLSLIEEFCGPLANRRVADLGCGGGLLAVPLLDKGANVTGVDISAASIAVASEASGRRGEFLVGDICHLPFPPDSFDLVLLMDVIEHIEQAEQVLMEASRVLVSGGKIMLGTINRTWSAWFWALVVAESFGLVPRGTHSYDLFRSPAELEKFCKAAGLTLSVLQGERPRIWSTIRHWAIDLEKDNSVAVAYTMVFTKQPATRE
jgi:2-polyprenyl-6-hydroxyphenyl methylase/3-demethylubiquinone-9 3-methyltransferase